MQAVALQTMLDKRLNGVRLDFGSRIRGSESGPPGWAEPLWNKKFRAPYVAHRVRRTPDGQVHVATQAGTGRGDLARLLQPCPTHRVSARPRPTRPAVPSAAQVAYAGERRGGRGLECSCDLRRGTAPLRFAAAALSVRAVREVAPETAGDRGEFRAARARACSLRSGSISSTLACATPPPTAA